MTMAQEQDDVEVESYEGYPIIATSIVVNKLGDGLSDAVAIDPVSISADEVAHLAVRVRKTKDRYDFIRDKTTGKILGVEWVQIFDSTGATFADSKMISVAVQKMVDKIEKSKADAKGQLSLVLGGDEEDETSRTSRRSHPDLATQVDEALGD
jgi:hypothetical protein